MHGLDHGDGDDERTAAIEPRLGPGPPTPEGARDHQPLLEHLGASRSDRLARQAAFAHSPVQFPDHRRRIPLAADAIASRSDTRRG